MVEVAQHTSRLAVGIVAQAAPVGGNLRSPCCDERACVVGFEPVAVGVGCRGYLVGDGAGALGPGADHESGVGGEELVDVEYQLQELIAAGGKCGRVAGLMSFLDAGEESL